VPASKADRGPIEEPGSAATSPETLRIAVVVTAAGSSERFGGDKKELRRVDERTILDRSLSPFLGLSGLEALVVTSPAGREAELRAALDPESLAALERLGPGRFAVVAGGPCRRDSVRLGLEALAKALGHRGSSEAEDPTLLDDVVVLVHDGARPWASADLALRVARSAAMCGASVPVLPLVDTPKELCSDGTVTRHPPRSAFGGAQTPQGFRLGTILAAHRRAAAEGLDCTDDAELWDRYVGPVAFVSGEIGNRKVTYAGDIAASTNYALPFRIGQGWDLHRLVPGRPLLIGGIEVPSDLGEDAHSDGDVLLHAVMDALLGAAALGDIGTHFPPSDELWRGADSLTLARRVAGLVREAGWQPGNLDCTVILEEPKLGPYKEMIRASLADCVGIAPEAVSVKAKTKEGVDAVGEGRAVEALALAVIYAVVPERS
jgi:2-C-methyl-D-erythritol 4-phosphate cytidylyltransferase/2-C-methyl-D-erythritol 2,4-cyclodiphosphate synthase